MDITGYELEPLRDDGDFSLFRARQPGNPISVLALVAARSASRSIARLEHEYALAGMLDARWAAQPLALNCHQAPATLVLDDNGGEPLDRALGRPLELTHFLHLAINLAIAVGHVHRRGLIHKDIKPANVLVDGSGNVRLTGFGIASRLPNERQQPAPPEIIAGTFAYMAPEQTGRMNRSIDARSDLYSLGVTLYEMLTGSLPFTASDAMEWIHCHIARRPTPPSERVSGIPSPVEAIVLKLLAKAAEDRYQTASGVEADLRSCLTAWVAHHRIDPFPLGARDTSDRLRIPERLYGREAQIEALVAAFDRVVVHGATELVLISGYAGIGKSSVVNELHKVLVPPCGLFASGKFDQYKRDIPYVTLAQAFQSLVRNLLSKSDAEVEPWRRALLDALGPNGQLMVNLIPELALIIGEQPPVPTLPPQDAQNRFQIVFRRFLGVFARPEHPLALFVDDLQWLDTATLDLIEHLVTHPEVRDLLLVGAYRDNEVGPSHPLTRTLALIRNAGGTVHETVLAPLLPDSVGQLVADSLHCDRRRAQPLAQLVHEKTGGNPFFAIQFLTALTEEALLAFDHGAAAWTWDLLRIRAKGFTENVADLMAAKLSRLSDTTRDALGQLACLGNAAEVATLTLFHGGSEEKIHAQLWEAVRAGLVFRADDAYAFVHDRVQEAAYALIPGSERAAVHLRIGRVLASRTAPEEIEEAIFDIVNHLNRGATLVTEWNEKQQIAELNLRAAKRAKASTAYASACMYLSAAMALLGSRGWMSRYDLAFAVWLERAQCEFLVGHLEVAERIVDALLRRGATRIDKAAAYRIKIDLHVVKSEHASAIDSALECLRLFGIDVPAHPTSEQVQAEYASVWNTLGDRSIGSLIDLPHTPDEEVQAAMGVLSVLFAPAINTDLNLIFLHLCKMINLSLRHGSTDAAASGYVWFGVFLGPVFHRYADGYDFGRLACEIVEKDNLIAYRAKTYFAMEICALWTQPIATGLRHLQSAFHAGVETGDITVACYSCNHVVTDLILRGDPLEDVWNETLRRLDFVRKAKFRDVVDVILTQQRFILNMQGKTSSFSSFSDAGFDEGAFESQLGADRMSAMVCWYWILKLQARCISGDNEVAIDAARKAKALLWSSVGHIQLLDYYYYGALAVAAVWDDEASPSRQEEWRELLKTHLDQLREWAENGSSTFRDKFELVAAEVARIEGRGLDAMRLYEQAVRSSRENGFVQNEGIANEFAGRFYLGLGLETNAYAHLRNARSCYVRWGADGKVRQLDRTHPQLRQESSRPDSTVATSVEQLDLTTVVKVSQAVFSEIDLNELIHTLMVLALEHAGANRGLLILPRGDKFRIEAEATTVRDAVEVRLPQTRVTPAALPESILRYVIRTQDSVLLDDASDQSPFSGDEHIRGNGCQSILCLPLIKQTKLIGVLYLENSLTPHVFTPARIAVLRLLASQAAISLENARLYADLQHAEALLADAQRLSHMGSFDWHVSSEEIFWSEESYRIFGYDSGTRPTVEMMLNRVHPDDLALVDQVIDRAANDKQGFDVEHRLLMPDGSIKHLHVVAHVVTDEPDPMHCVGAVMDITVRKQAHAALERNEHRYRSLFRDMPVALWQTEAQPLIAMLTDLRAQGVEDLSAYIDDHPDWLRHAEEVLVIEEVNNYAVQMFGAQDRSELLGPVTWVWRESPGTFRRILESRYCGEELFQETTKLPTLDGRVLDVLFTVARPRIADDLGIGLISLVDLTERIRAQEMLQRLQADFAHAARISMLGELTASIAHELNQPLAAIATNGEAGLRWLDRPVPNVAEVRESNTRIIADARRAADIVGRIRGMAVRRAPEHSLASLDELIDGALVFLHHEIQSRGVTVSRHLAPGMPKVLADRVQFQQVIVNLVVNAIQAMEQAGSTERRITIRTAMPHAVTLRCAVEDSGPGIVPEHLDRLFDSFFTTKPDGMGMGLPICRSIIEAHGGRIAADNESAHGGARVYFTLPAADYVG